MKTLYVSDLDGTLLHDDSRISAYSRQVLNELTQQGVAFTFATARSIHSASKVSEGLHLRIPLIVYNGVYLLDPEDYHIIDQQEFAPSIVDRILRLAFSYDVEPFVYTYIDGKERVLYREKGLHEGGVHYRSSRPNDTRFRCVNERAQLSKGNIFYLTFIQDRKALEPLYNELLDQDTMTVTFQQELGRSEYWLEIMPASASKANAIKKLKALGGYDYVVSFGDAINDLPMFQFSDEAYAVANAIDELKQHASGIIASNQDDGVAKWMKEHAKGCVKKGNVHD